jgi:hypothetical protein
LGNLQAIHLGKEKKRKEKKKMSKGSSTTADKQITGDPREFLLYSGNPVTDREGCNRWHNNKLQIQTPFFPSTMKSNVFCN